MTKPNFAACEYVGLVVNTEVQVFVTAVFALMQTSEQRWSETYSHL